MTQTESSVTLNRAHLNTAYNIAQPSPAHAEKPVLRLVSVWTRH